ncbi:MAG TPA: deoxyribodipyrimidine photo-lyase [Bacteroidales bacterium]|nr:deoxyribodipyrimidine photo-lyase [Bacteroidales bacterium]HNS46171.1 deoxyribodipyrimidine photo-lyase [Bacteroidales bacterium]
MAITLFWFRRDLRLEDNTGLHYALKEKGNVRPVFIFDRNILDKLEDRNDARITFIHRALERIQSELLRYGSSLLVLQGDPVEIFKKLTSEKEVSAVYCNHDYEPYARDRDKKIADLLNDRGIEFRSFKDQVIFEKNEVTKADGTPYTVFTPYMNRWKAHFYDTPFQTYDVKAYSTSFDQLSPRPLLSIDELGFIPSEITMPPPEPDKDIIRNYHLTRDLPSVNGTSRMSVHLRFGTVSVRHLVRLAWELNEKWLNELIWREFYMGNILWHFPRVTNSAFKPAYDSIHWLNNEKDFEAWCTGRTGFPLVDAGMRELNTTGFMHNRLRMVTASFLVKHLLVDWRWGEAWFARKLLDFELASNNGGWQWAAGTGCDAAPYFRVFNPYLQTKKYDPQEKYVQDWVPEYRDPERYPAPIVDQEMARKRVIATYRKALL